jgi:hypothetical protein
MRLSETGELPDVVLVAQVDLAVGDGDQALVEPLRLPLAADERGTWKWVSARRTLKSAALGAGTRHQRSLETTS